MGFWKIPWAMKWAEMLVRGNMPWVVGQAYIEVNIVGWRNVGAMFAFFRVCETLVPLDGQ